MVIDHLCVHISIIQLTFFNSSLPTEVKEYCQLELFNASCLENQVIVVTSAQYGRMRIGRCVLRAYGSLGCTTDVLDQLDRLCSGRQQCSFHVSSLHNRHPCPQDLTPFLEASYYCQNGNTFRCLNCFSRFVYFPPEFVRTAFRPLSLIPPASVKEWLIFPLVSSPFNYILRKLA